MQQTRTHTRTIRTKAGSNPDAQYGRGVRTCEDESSVTITTQHDSAAHSAAFSMAPRLLPAIPGNFTCT